MRKEKGGELQTPGLSYSWLVVCRPKAEVGLPAQLVTSNWLLWLYC